jgi:hypothetical protein
MGPSWVAVREAARAGTGILSGGLRVPNAAATIEITAYLRASRIRCAITVDAGSLSGLERGGRS